MWKTKIAGTILGMMMAANAAADVVYTATVKATGAENNKIYCQVTNISKQPQTVTVEMFSYDGTPLSPAKTTTIDAERTEWPTSVTPTPPATNSIWARCKFKLNKAKVRAGVGVYKALGDGSIETYLEAR